MAIQRTEVQQAKALIEAATHITVVSHVRPDGDAVGSMLALTLALQAQGKQVTPVLQDLVPERFGFLPGAGQVRNEFPQDPGLLISVDCAESARIGFAERGPATIPQINIDHHQTNSGFAAVNLVDPAAASTTEVLYLLAAELDLELSPQVCENLLAGLLTDTIGFRTVSVTSRTLRLSAELLELGTPLARLYESVLNSRSFTAARFWGYGLARLMQENGLIWTALTSEDRQASQYASLDDADLIDLITTIEGVRVALLFIEQPGNQVKVSWRALQGDDVARIAGQFGGGGHKPAAGATIPGSLEEVREVVLTATRKLMA